MKFILALFCALPFVFGLPQQNSTPQPTKRLEDLQNKTILLFTPHPDDDVFGAGGTIALLNRNHNKVYIVVYTNDDKGSYDPDMNSQRLAQIRRSEQEVSEEMLGTLKQNIIWMSYDDGMLEYAAQPKLTEEATAVIRRIRPDVLLSVDPGEWFEHWHKSDHRMAAFNTIDAVRAAEFWLYFQINGCNEACSLTRSPKCISSIHLLKKPTIL
jgi:LmbE family N-acetylglucosaminyl deacetylase